MMPPPRGRVHLPVRGCPFTSNSGSGWWAVGPLHHGRASPALRAALDDLRAGIGDLIVHVFSLGMVSRMPVGLRVNGHLRCCSTAVAAPVLIGRTRHAQELVQAAHSNLNAPGGRIARFVRIVLRSGHSRRFAVAAMNAALSR